MAWKMNDQSNAGLVSIMLTNIAASTRMIAMATHLPGCRTGTAWIRPGRLSSFMAVRG